MPPAPHLQNKPLFPSAAAIASTAMSSTSDSKATTTSAAIGPVKPTFPAYSGVNSSNGPQSSSEQKVPLINNIGGTSRIIHPPEDISLEEIRSRMPKYKVGAGSIPPEDNRGSPAASQVNTPTSSVASQQQPVEQEKQRMIGRLPVGSLQCSVAGMLPPVSSVAIMASACPPIVRAPPTIPLIPANMSLIRPPQMSLHPGQSGQLWWPEEQKVTPAGRRMTAGLPQTHFRGLIGGVVPPPPAGVMGHYGAGPQMAAFPGPPVLTPMMPPRFR